MFSSQRAPIPVYSTTTGASGGNQQSPLPVYVVNPGGGGGGGGVTYPEWYAYTGGTETTPAAPAPSTYYKKTDGEALEEDVLLLQDQIDDKAPIANPVFTGNVNAPDLIVGKNNTGSAQTNSLNIGNGVNFVDNYLTLKTGSATGRQNTVTIGDLTGEYTNLKLAGASSGSTNKILIGQGQTNQTNSIELTGGTGSNSSVLIKSAVTNQLRVGDGTGTTNYLTIVGPSLSSNFLRVGETTLTNQTNKIECVGGTGSTNKIVLGSAEIVNNNTPMTTINSNLGITKAYNVSGTTNKLSIGGVANSTNILELNSTSGTSGFGNALYVGSNTGSTNDLILSGSTTGSVNNLRLGWGTAKQTNNFELSGISGSSNTMTMISGGTSTTNGIVMTNNTQNDVSTNYIQIGNGTGNNNNLYLSGRVTGGCTNRIRLGNGKNDQTNELELGGIGTTGCINKFTMGADTINAFTKDISAATQLDTELPTALAVKTALGNYVDKTSITIDISGATQLDTKIPSAKAVKTELGNYVNKAGDTIVGPLTLNSTFLLKDAATITGNVTINKESSTLLLNGTSTGTTNTIEVSNAPTNQIKIGETTNSANNKLIISGNTTSATNSIIMGNDLANQTNTLKIGGTGSNNVNTLTMGTKSINGFCRSDDTTFFENIDNMVPTNKAVIKYINDHGTGGAYLPLAGGTMTGDINMGGKDLNQVRDIHCVNTGVYDVGNLTITNGGRISWLGDFTTGPTLVSIYGTINNYNAAAEPGRKNSTNILVSSEYLTSYVAAGFSTNNISAVDLYATGRVSTASLYITGNATPIFYYCTVPDALNQDSDNAIASTKALRKIVASMWTTLSNTTTVSVWERVSWAWNVEHPMNCLIKYNPACGMMFITTQETLVFNVGINGVNLAVKLNNITDYHPILGTRTPFLLDDKVYQIKWGITGANDTKLTGNVMDGTSELLVVIYTGNFKCHISGTCIPFEAN